MIFWFHFKENGPQNEQQWKQLQEEEEEEEKRQPSYDHKHNVILHSAHEGKQKCRKGVIPSATAAIYASQIKGCYMCMHSSCASAPHFCLQSTPRKDTMKVESRPYDSNYAIKISEN